MDSVCPVQLVAQGSNGPRAVCGALRGDVYAQLYFGHIEIRQRGKCSLDERPIDDTPVLASTIIDAIIPYESIPARPTHRTGGSPIYVHKKHSLLQVLVKQRREETKHARPAGRLFDSRGGQAALLSIC